MKSPTRTWRWRADARPHIWRWTPSGPGSGPGRGIASGAPAWANSAAESPGGLYTDANNKLVHPFFTVRDAFDTKGVAEEARRDCLPVA